MLVRYCWFLNPYYVIIGSRC